MAALTSSPEPTSVPGDWNHQYHEPMVQHGDSAPYKSALLRLERTVCDQRLNVSHEAQRVRQNDVYQADKQCRSVLHNVHYQQIYTLMNWSDVNLFDQVSSAALLLNTLTNSSTYLKFILWACVVKPPLFHAGQDWYGNEEESSKRIPPLLIRINEVVYYICLNCMLVILTSV